MKVTLYMAMSVNGIIARENNDEDFISHSAWETVLSLVRKTGCLVWGRKTQEVVRTWGEDYLQEIKDFRKIVVSTNPNLALEPGFTLADSPEQALEILKNEGFKEVILTGGSILNTAFAKSSLIDEVIFQVEPVIVGKGIPVFQPDSFDLNLSLIEVKEQEDGTLQLHYKVLS